jgi:hypothetical protein
MFWQNGLRHVAAQEDVITACRNQHAHDRKLRRAEILGFVHKDICVPVSDLINMLRQGGRKPEIVNDSHCAHLDFPLQETGEQVGSTIYKNRKLPALSVDYQILISCAGLYRGPNPVELLPNVRFSVHATRIQRFVESKKRRRVMIVCPAPVIFTEYLVDMLIQLPGDVLIVMRILGLERRSMLRASSKNEVTSMRPRTTSSEHAASTNCRNMPAKLRFSVSSRTFAPSFLARAFQ